MLRRSAIATLCGAGSWLRAESDRLAEAFEGAHGTAVVLDAQSGKVLAVHAPELAGRLAAPPGSTLKPFVLGALVESGKLRPGERWKCAGDLWIGGRSMTCSHPPVMEPMDTRAALAYSCNGFVAHMVERFGENELALALARAGIECSLRPGDARLLALGEDGVTVTAAGLAAAYRRLALRCGRAAMAPVLGGMEDAVEYGTAQRARVAARKVAGKTGSVVSADGVHLAWFAGFAPSRSPKVALAVMVQGRSGGADAAPVAGRILEGM